MYELRNWGWNFIGNLAQLPEEESAYGESKAEKNPFDEYPAN